MVAGIGRGRDRGDRADDRRSTRGCGPRMGRLRRGGGGLCRAAGRGARNGRSRSAGGRPRRRIRCAGASPGRWQPADSRAAGLRIPDQSTAGRLRLLGCLQTRHRCLEHLAHAGSGARPGSGAGDKRPVSGDGDFLRRLVPRGESGRASTASDGRAGCAGIGARGALHLGVRARGAGRSRGGPGRLGYGALSGVDSAGQFTDAGAVPDRPVRHGFLRVCDRAPGSAPKRPGVDGGGRPHRPAALASVCAGIARGAARSMAVGGQVEAEGPLAGPGRGGRPGAGGRCS